MSWSWYKRDAHAFFYGTRTLSLEDRGAFNDILELQYMHGGKLADEDKFFKAALGISGQKWGAIKRRLIKAGKIICEDGFIWNKRALEEIENRHKACKKQEEVSRKSSRSDEEVQKKLPRSCREVAEKLDPVSLKNNDLACQSPRVHAGEDKNRIEIDKKDTSPLPPPKSQADMRAALTAPMPENVYFENGQLILAGGLRRHWLAKFGSEERLELAIGQASGYVQPNSFRPLEAQVSAQLSRIAAQKMDSDQRYRAAAQAKSTQNQFAAKERAADDALLASVRKFAADNKPLRMANG